MTALAVIAAAELVLITFLIWDRTRAQAPLLRTVENLCQRIQGPGAAVLEHDEQVRERRDEEYAPPALEPEDDEAYWLSRDKLAEYAMREELSGRNG